MTLKHSVLMLALLISCQTVSRGYGQGAAQAPVNARGEHRKTSEPYTGDLSIFDSPGRDRGCKWIASWTFWASRRERRWRTLEPGRAGSHCERHDVVGERGEVYAVDINPESIRYVDARAQKEQVHNIKTILSKPDNPLLPVGSVDAVLLLKTYHEVAEPVVLLRNLRVALVPAPRLESSTATEMARTMEWAAT